MLSDHRSDVDCPLGLKTVSYMRQEKIGLDEVLDFLWVFHHAISHNPRTTKFGLVYECSKKAIIHQANARARRKCLFPATYLRFMKCEKADARLSPACQLSLLNSNPTHHTFCSLISTLEAARLLLALSNHFENHMKFAVKILKRNMIFRPFLWDDNLSKNCVGYTSPPSNALAPCQVHFFIRNVPNSPKDQNPN